MTVYPIIPLTPTWSNSETETADIAKTKYGETGVERRTTNAIRMMLVFLVKHTANILFLGVISAICFPHLTMTNEGWMSLLVISMNLERIKNYRAFLYGGFLLSCLILNYFL